MRGFSSAEYEEAKRRVRRQAQASLPPSHAGAPDRTGSCFALLLCLSACLHALLPPASDSPSWSSSLPTAFSTLSSALPAAGHFLQLNRSLPFPWPSSPPSLLLVALFAVPTVYQRTSNHFILLQLLVSCNA
eukprot:24868-Hanusia_phi.AAC.5